MCFFILFSPEMETEVEILQHQIRIFDKMCVSATNITENTEYPETLGETERIQNVSEG